MSNHEENCREFNIPVPWGHIAAKAWGTETDTPILVFHGRSDNAGAFDNLIPLLPKEFYYICFDLPSHGKSSHFPPHTPLYSTNFLLAYTYIMNYFKQKSYIIIGHSYGGHLGFLYGRLYPERVDKLVMIDTVYYDVVSVGDFTSYLTEKYNVHVKQMDKMSSGKQPSYTYEVAKEKLMLSRETDPLTDSAATALLKRSLIPVDGDKYVFSTDQRMKNYFDMLHDFRYAVDYLENEPITCPVLMLLGSRNKAFHDLYKPTFDVLKKWDHVSINYVEGGHDVHNNSPENVAPHISKFLLEKGPVKKYLPPKPSTLQRYLRLLRWAKL